MILKASYFYIDPTSKPQRALNTITKLIKMKSYAEVQFYKFQDRYRELEFKTSSSAEDHGRVFPMKVFAERRRLRGTTKSALSIRFPRLELVKTLHRTIPELIDTTEPKAF